MSFSVCGNPKLMKDHLCVGLICASNIDGLIIHLALYMPLILSVFIPRYSYNLGSYKY